MIVSDDLRSALAAELVAARAALDNAATLLAAAEAPAEPEPEPTTEPPAPTGLTFSVEPGAASFVWDDPGDVDGWVVYPDWSSTFEFFRVTVPTFTLEGYGPHTFNVSAYRLDGDAFLDGPWLPEHVAVDLGPTPAPEPDPGEEEPPPPPADYNPALTPFSPTGFAFNVPIPAGAEPHERSAAIVSGCLGYVTQDRTRILCAPYTAVNEASAGDPTWTVSTPQGTWTIKGPATIRRGPSPDYATLIRDPETMREVRVFLAGPPNASARTISGQGGGLFNYGPDSDGRPLAGIGTGCGLSSSAGLARMAEFAAGEIRHAIRLHLNSAEFTDGGYVPPATKSDQPHPSVAPGGTRNPASAVDMGMRVQLDPTLNPDDYAGPLTGLNRAAHRAIFRALQVYGGIFVDGTGTGISVNLESVTDAATYLGPDNGFGSWSHLLRDGRIPWSRFRVLA